jgi:hypothetical protein
MIVLLMVVIPGMTMTEIEVTQFVVNDNWVLVNDSVRVKNWVIRYVVVGITLVVVAEVKTSPVLVIVGTDNIVVVVVLDTVKDSVSV